MVTTQKLEPLSLFSVVLETKIKKPPIDYRVILLHPKVRLPVQHTSVAKDHEDFDVNKFDNS